MPFDPKGFAPNVTILPPQGPERPPGGRVHIEVVIHGPPPRKPRSGFLEAAWTLFWLIVLLSLLGAAHGEERRITAWPGGGGLTMQDNHGNRGQAWESTPGTWHQEWQDPSGHVTRCDTRRNGPTVTEDCH